MNGLDEFEIKKPIGQFVRCFWGGGSLTIQSYDTALGGTVSWLLARETLAFEVCK